MKNFKYQICLFLSMTLLIVGCAETGQPERNNGSAIELIEPLDDTGGLERAALRTLFDADVFSATVVPYTVEYSFEKDVKFDEFCVFPGEEVKKGSLLAKADTSSLEKTIENKEKQIREMEENYEEYCKETQEGLTDPKKEEKNLEEILEDLKEEEPEEWIAVAGQTELQKNPAYTAWKNNYSVWEEKYRVLAHRNYMTEVEMEQKRQLYELDHEYALKQLSNLRNQLKQLSIKSTIAGNIVAVNGIQNGNYVGDKTNVIAVGDTAQKRLKSEYINKSIITKAKDVYAMVNGKRYEVDYQAIDADEYARLSSQNGKVFSTFLLREDTDEISVGDFAVIVVVNELRENVLTIPKNAVYEGELGSFVNLREGEETKTVDITTGMSDGVYTEVLSGLKEGDQILVAERQVPGESRETVKLGEFHYDFSGSGYMAYPSGSKETNPVKYGTVYFVEYAVSVFDHVEKGDVVARIRVEKDEVAIKRNRLKLQRLKERLEPLMKDEESKEANKKAIEAQEEQIREVQKLLDEMNADSVRKEIKASESGIVVNLAYHKAEDILWPGADLVEIADESTCYVVLENKNQLLQYGNEVRITYQNKEGQKSETTGMVGNLSEAGVSKSLKSDEAMILLPAEKIPDMPAMVETGNGWYMRSSFNVEAKLRSMQQVPVVPRSAVWEKEGQTYVFVVEKDGTVTARSFLAGGYDSTNYWVVSGLTEGMEICLR